MKIKINWGWGIVIALISFMIFILSFVFQMLFNDTYDHQLVSENYYKDELLYQLELNKLENAKKLKTNVRLEKEFNELKIVFPEDFEASDISGMAYFQYIVDEKHDFEIPLEVKNHQVIIDHLKLKKGAYNVKIDWKYQNKSYLLKEKINF